MAFNPVSFEHVYGFELFDTIHNFFPEIMYDEDLFTSESENWMRHRMSHFFPAMFSRQQNIYRIYRSNAMRDEFNNWRLGNIVVPNEPQSLPLHRTNVSFSRPRFSRQPVRSNRAQYPTTRTTRTSDYDQTPEMLISILGNSLSTRFLDEELAAASNIFTDVLVAPTVQQIEDASRLVDHSAISAETECAVCQDHGAEPRVWRILHCQHSFHKHCIDQWFRQNVHCPVCRSDIRVARRMPPAQQTHSQPTH